MRPTGMEIPLIERKVFNKFAKHLPTPRGNQKIAPIVIISCVIWVVKHGRYWSDIPIRYGNHDTIRKRFIRWSKKEIFRKVFYSCTKMLGNNNIAAIDSTFAKAHRTACSLKSDGKPRQIGLTKGGRNTKIHMITNIEQKPIDFCLSPGHASDCKEGEKLIGKNIHRIKKLLADKAYDTNNIRKMLDSQKVGACIPSKSNRKTKIPHDESLYKKRSGIEIMFGRIKDWRGIATRYCRCAHAFDSFVCVALIILFFCVR